MDNLKKVLIFSVAYDPFWGGAEVAVREITKRIPDIEFHMVTPRFDNSDREKKIGNVLVHRIDSSKNLFPIKAFLFASKLQKKYKYDIVWSIMANYAGFAALFFKMRFSKVKFLLTLQEGDPIEYILKRVGPLRPLFKQIFRKADMIQAISTFLAKFGKDMGHTKPIPVIPNGVDITVFSQTFTDAEKDEMKQKLGKKDGEVYLVTTSRLVTKNAIDDLILSLTHLPKHISLLIIGEGDLRSKLDDLVHEHKLGSRVKFLGFIPYSEIPQYFAVSDIFIRPSRSEGFGNSFVEAILAGLPVVGTPVGGIVDFLEDKKTGVFCQPDDPKSIAEAVQLILNDENIRSTIIQNGKEMVLRKYDWETIAKDMKIVLKS